MATPKAAPTKAPSTIPVIDGLQGKIGVIERRLEYLKRRLDRPDYAASSSADFDKSEVSALEAAVQALRYVDRVRPSVCG